MNRKSIIFVLLCVILLSGCAKDTEGENTQFQVSGGPNRNTTEEHLLTLSMRVPETLNPLRNRDESVDTVLKLIYQPLVDFDESGKVAPGVAESWKISEDGKVISLVLRSDILWQNGEKLTADDVVFSVDTIKGATEDSVYKNVLQYVESCVKTGEYTVDVYFRDTFSGNLSSLGFPVISAGYYSGQTDLKSDANMTPMGSGPYSLLTYDMASAMTLIANAAYIYGSPSISEILVKTTAGEETDIYAFEQGMTDILVADASQAGKYATKGISGIYQFASREYDFVGFNFNKELFQNKTMRQAVAYAFPKKNIHESVYLQYAQMTNTPVNPKSWLYEENVVPYEYDTTISATFLKNAGWADSNQDGKLERDGENGLEPLQVTILVNQENTARRQTASKLKEELSLLGFTVTVDQQPFAQYEEKFKNGDFDLVVGGWKMSGVTDLSPFFMTGGSLNFIGYSDEQTDRLLSAAYGAVGEGKTLLAYSSLQKRLAEELPYISIAYRSYAVFASNRVGGEIKPTADNVFRTVHQWTFDEKKTD